MKQVVDWFRRFGGVAEFLMLRVPLCKGSLYIKGILLFRDSYIHGILTSRGSYAQGLTFRRSYIQDFYVEA